LSETDSFIREVEDEVRQDRMFRLWKKYGPYAIAGVVGAVAISAGLTWMKHQEREQARELGGAFLAAPIGSVPEQEALIGETEGAVRAVAEMRLAAAKAQAGEAEAAAELYRKAASVPGLDRAYSDLAKLQVVRVSVATMDPGEAVAALEPLAADGAPYRLLALELRAAIRLSAGETEAAHDDLRAIVDDPAVTRELLQRASVMLLSSGGEMPAVTQ
jgi:hypothetical protein